MHQLHTYSSVTYHNQFILLLLQGSEVLIELNKNSLSGSLMINHVQDEGLESTRTHNPAFSIIIIINKTFYIKTSSVLIQEGIRTLPRYKFMSKVIAKWKLQDAFKVFGFNNY